MGQHASKPAETAVVAQLDQPNARGAASSHSFRRLRALSWAQRSPVSTRNKPARTTAEPARRRSFFGSLFKDRRNSGHNESQVIQVSARAAGASPVSVEEPTANPVPMTQSSNAGANPAETRNAPPGTLMIVHGTMPSDEGQRRSTSSLDHSASDTPRLSSDTSTNEIGSDLSSHSDASLTTESSPSLVSSSTAPDDRLQSSIDVLAALLSMATAATATSLLTGTTDVLSTLSTDSPAGPHVSPTRARTAWDTLENLFYLRSSRQSNLSPHIELFRDLALAVLSSRSINPPRVIPEARADRVPLPPGTFERFLVDLNANVRNSLRDDYVRRGPDASDPQRRLNWWRAYQFPGVAVPPGPHTASHAGNSHAHTAPNANPYQQSPLAERQTSSIRSSQPGSSPRLPMSTSENLIPVVIVGLRSLSRDPNSRSPLSSQSPYSSSENTQTSPASGGGSPAGINNPVRPTPADEIDAITSSYVIIVLGGHYPPEHRYASATGSDDSNDLDSLWDLVELVPFKPATATAEEISKSGLTCFKASEMSTRKVAENTAERCLICLEEYVDDVELRLLSCTHAFHRSCVDRWLTEGQNGCPLCRAQGVQR